MSTSTSFLAYTDCFELFDQALASQIGIRFPCKDPGEANQWRVRLHAARKRHREANKETYPDPADPRHGHSEYDPITVRIRQFGERLYVYLEPRDISRVGVEDLAKLESDTGATPVPPTEAED